jgi:hypothetical protein
MLEKLEIIGYTDVNYKSKGGSVKVSINPATYKEDLKVDYHKGQTQGTAGQELKFKSVIPSTISFDIHFDSTGAIKGSTEAVDAQLTSFKKVCFKYSGDTHSPNYLLITWGSLNFKCVLTSLSVSYTLFAQDGTPLRAKATVQLEGARSAKNIAQEAGNQSPDLTHKVIVRAGDNLPALCQEIYEDKGYYLEVAKHNGLVNFINLQPGTILKFPPLK